MIFVNGFRKILVTAYNKRLSGFDLPIHPNPSLSALTSDTHQSLSETWIGGDER